VEQASEPRRDWQGRPWLGGALKLGIQLAPLVLVTFTLWRLNRHVPPADDWTGTVLRWVGLSIAATALLMMVDRLLRRLLPLAMLVRLTLVFPDQAPSRFKLALRAQSVR